MSRNHAFDPGIECPSNDLCVSYTGADGYAIDHASTQAPDDLHIDQQQHGQTLSSKKREKQSKKLPNPEISMISMNDMSVSRDETGSETTWVTESEFTESVTSVRSLQDVRPDLGTTGPDISATTPAPQSQTGVSHPPGGPFPRIWRQLKCLPQDLGSMRKGHNIVIVLCVLIPLLIVFVSLMPYSFSYVEYSQLALKRTNSTLAVENHTYYHGCYMLGPDAHFIYFRRSAYLKNLTAISFFTSNRLEVTFNGQYIYFIRPEELGLLWDLYEFEFPLVLQNIVISTLKNWMVRYTLDELRLNRTEIQVDMHNVIRRKLDAFHVDVKYFFLLEVDVPSDISELFLKQTLLTIDQDTEVFKQQHALVQLETELLSDAYINKANEIAAAGSANGSFIEAQGRALAWHSVEDASILGWDRMSTRLVMTNMEHKLSILLISSLNKISDISMSVGPSGYYNRSIYAGTL